MKNALWIFFMLVCAGASAQKPTDCSRFKTGVFKMTYGGKETRIVRTANKQFQYFDNEKIPLVYNIKWVDDCSFTLTPEKPIANKPGIPPNAMMMMQIVKTTKNSYTQITTANFTRQIIKGEIYKVR